MKVADLFVYLGVETDEDKIKKFDFSLKALSKTAGGMAAAFTAAIVALDRFTNGTVKSVAALRDLNFQTGLSIDKLQKWQQAGQLSNLNLSADEITNSINSVQQKLTEIKLGVGDAMPFIQAGIDPTSMRDAFQVLDELRSRVGRISSSKMTFLLQNLGINPSMIATLRLTNSEFNKLSKNRFLSEQQRADIEKMGRAWLQWKLHIQALKDQAVAKIAPALENLINKFFIWVEENGDNIIAIISGIATAFANFAAAISRVSAMIGNLVIRMANLLDLKASLVLFGYAVALIFRPITIAVTALLLLLDDLAVYTSGKGKSMIGELMNFVNGGDGETKAKPEGEVIRAPFGLFTLRRTQKDQVQQDIENDMSSKRAIEEGKLNVKYPELGMSKPSSVDTQLKGDNIVNVYVESYGDPRNDGRIIGSEVSQAMVNYGNTGR